MKSDFIYYKSYHTCNQCKKRIPLYCNDVDRIFDGHFIAIYSNVSELVNNYVPDIHSVVCMSCYLNLNQYINSANDINADNSLDF